MWVSFVQLIRYYLWISHRRNANTTSFPLQELSGVSTIGSPHFPFYFVDQFLQRCGDLLIYMLSLD